MVKEPTCQAGDVGSSPLCLEKERATYPNILAWEIPWTEEPGSHTTVHGVVKELGMT